jgi:hypothetical protein
MSGGKSSSSSTQQTSQSTTSQDASGVVGDVIQGQTINITDNLPEDVKALFGGLIDLASQSIDAAVGAGSAAIESVSNVKTTAISPDTSQLKTLTPVLIIAGIALVVFAFRKG